MSDSEMDDLQKRIDEAEDNARNAQLKAEMARTNLYRIGIDKIEMLERWAKQDLETNAPMSEIFTLAAQGQRYRLGIPIDTPLEDL